MTNSAGVASHATVKECSVGLKAVEVGKFWFQGAKRVKADLAQSPTVTGAECGVGEGLEESLLDISGRSDYSCQDPCYSPLPVLPSDSGSDPGEDPSTSRPKSSNKW